MVAAAAPPEEDKSHQGGRLACRQGTRRDVPEGTDAACLEEARKHGDGGFFRSYRFPVRGKSDKGDSGSGDSIWGVVLGWAKNLNMSPHEVLYDISYANILLYMKATPCWNDKKDDWDASIDACDPKNFKNKQTNNNEEIYVR